MKKIKKIILISIVSLFLISGIILGVYKIFKDKNSLTISEKTWISNNKNSVYNEKDCCSKKRIERKISFKGKIF